VTACLQLVRQRGHTEWEEEIAMKFLNLNLLSISLLVTALITAAFADDVTVDYDHGVNFNQVKTYCWSKVETSNSIWDGRVKNAVDKELAAKGWTEVPSGGDIALLAVEKTSVQQQYDTFYNGFGGWWRGGFGETTTAIDNYKVGTLVVSMFDVKSKHLIWRGTASGTLSSNPDKNAKNLDKNVQKMFKHFPAVAKGAGEPTSGLTQDEKLCLANEDCGTHDSCRLTCTTNDTVWFH
jgi:Domain of unknown function (DUF4136)